MFLVQTLMDATRTRMQGTPVLPTTPVDFRS